VAVGESGDAVCWMVIVDDDGGRGEVGFRAVDNTQIEHRHLPMLDLGIGIVSKPCRNGFHSCAFRPGDSQNHSSGI